MRLRSFRLQNVGLFTDATVELGRNAAVIAGKNNSGKTTLLTALGMAASPPARPELPRTRTVEQLTKTDQAQFSQRMEWVFEVELADVEAQCLRDGHTWVPAIPGYNERGLLPAVDAGELLAHRALTWRGRERSAFEQYTSPRTASSFGYILQDGHLAYSNNQGFHEQHVRKLIDEGGTRIFRFDADRSRIHEKQVRRMPEIDSRGEELITAFNFLSSQEKLRFLHQVQRVLPEITHLESVPSSSAGHTQIRLWFGSDHRESLSFNLAEVGYGTANVLAILFAATVGAARRILLIDEPSTYLHPRAVRELMAVLAEHKQHQYIFATHSFVGLESFPDASFSLCERKPGDEHATVVNCGAGPAADARRLLRDVGSSLSDVFGADRILWTEGPSDADVLELVLRDLRAPRGIAVRPILHTGDFDGHDAKPDPSGKRPALITKIYTTLSTSSALIPPAIAFVFDREQRTETQLKDLRRAIEGNVPTKEPRPKLALYDEHMLENLFLDAEVVVDALHQVARAEKVRVKVSPPDLEAFWDGLDDPKRFLTGKRPDDPKQWRKKVHGARVLEATFEHFFGDTVAFRKTTHDRMLAATALRLNSPGAASLRAFVQKLLAGNKDPEVPA